MNGKTTKRIIRDQLSLRQAFADPCSGTIYHYTNAEGLRGIVDKHEIWMTNTAFVNDPTECKALSNAKDLFAETDLSNEFVKKAWADFLDPVYKDYNDYYIASFSKVRDSLEQWRAYGNFCIGFDAEKLSNLKSRVKLYECVYDKQEIKKWILKKEKRKEWKNKVTGAKENAAGDLLFNASLKYKDKNYEGEKEVRLITVSASKTFYVISPKPPDQLPIHFRDHLAYRFPVPYVKFFITKNEQHETSTKETGKGINQRKLNDEGEKERHVLPITEVMIGPMAHQKEANIAYEIFLFERGYKNVTVCTSKISYRGF